VKHERLAYDTRRFVTGWGASNMRWDGTLVSIPGSAVIEDRMQLSILDVEAEGAKARLALRVPIPTPNSTPEVGPVQPGGLFVAYRLGKGHWFARMVDELSVRQVARVRYGVRCAVTYRVIEALCRVEFGGEFGISPDLEFFDNAKAGGGCARIRLLAHVEVLDAISLLGEAPLLGMFEGPPIRIRDVLVALAALDPRTFVKGEISLLSSTVSIPGWATVVGFIELRDAPLQPGTLVELGCKMKSSVASKCGLVACPKCSHRWRLNTFEGSTAGTFIMHNRSRPLKERMSLKSVIRHAPF
jgi:hypothetical protein